jgi:hypothetical protein
MCSSNPPVQRDANATNLPALAAEMMPADAASER